MHVCLYNDWIIFLRSCSKLIQKLNNATCNTIVEEKINEIIGELTILEENIKLIHIWMDSFRKELDERAKRVFPEVVPNAGIPVEPLTNFGFRPEIYCTCGKNVTACCPIHPKIC